MTKSVSFFLVFFSLLLLLVVASATVTASAGNATIGLSFDGCAPGSTIGECITAKVEEEEEGAEAVVRRILQDKSHLAYPTLGRRPVCDAKITANCIRRVGDNKGQCGYYTRCKRSPS